jgi:ABC-type branched-subunit amino acid transport system ATPase component
VDAAPALSDHISVMVRGEVALAGPTEALDPDAVQRLLTV